METLQKTAIAGTKAVKRLRLQKLRAGHPFMINSKELTLLLVADQQFLPL
jgi:hypothetical protein